MDDERESHSLLPPWPLLDAASSVGGKGCGIPLMLLGCFASEGDNVPHAMDVAKCSLSLLGLDGIGREGGEPEACAGPAPLLRVPCSFAALYGRSSGLHTFLG